MEYFVAFENGKLILSQKNDNSTKTADFDIRLVPQINKALADSGLPSLYQWVSYGLDVVPLLQLTMAAGAVQLFKEGERFYDQAQQLLSEASLALTGKMALASACVEITASAAESLTSEELEKGAEELRHQWPHIYYHLSNDE